MYEDPPVQSMTEDPDVQKMMEKQRIHRAVLKRISIERHNQDKQWGGDDHDDTHNHHDWIAYIVKHLGRAVSPWNIHRFKDNMIKVAALAVASIEWIERNDTRNKEGNKL